MVKETPTLEWITVQQGDDPKRFSIEDVRRGQYDKHSWMDRLKRWLRIKNA